MRVMLYPSEYLTYGTGASPAIVTKADGSHEYHITDHLGSVRVVLDDAKTVVARKDYEPYGEVRAVTGEAPRQGYIGKEVDRESDLAMHGVRAYSASEGRFLSIDPLLEKFRAVTPYQYSLNNPVGLLDADGEKPYTFILRSFHPSTSFGLGFHGDNRGFSSAYKASSRVNMYLTLETGSGEITPPREPYCDPSFHPLLSSNVGTVRSNYPSMADWHMDQFGSTHFAFGAEYASHNPLLPSPDIDVQSQFSVMENKEDGILTITGSITGDQFPNAEALVADSKKQTVFLGAFTRPNNSNPFQNLPGKGTAPMMAVNVQITLDKNGNFTGVISGGRRYTIAQWNRQFQNRNPHPQKQSAAD